MPTFHPVIRGGPTWLAFLGLAWAVAAPASSYAEPPRYTIRGSFEAGTRPRDGAAAAMRVDARLSPPARDTGLQAGGHFIVVASMASSPLGCVDDTIFVDGFETSG